MLLDQDCFSLIKKTLLERDTNKVLQVFFFFFDLIKNK